MKKQGSITWILLLCLAPVMFSCNSSIEDKKINERVTLRHTDKIPYGTYVAFENLHFIFPGAEVEVNKISPSNYKSFTYSYDYPTEDNSANEKTLYIIISPYFDPDLREYNALMRFIGQGNHVFIAADYWGREFCDSLKMDVSDVYRDSVWTSVQNPVTYDSLAFTYPGNSIGGYFIKFDSTYANILGRNDSGNVNFIKHSYQGGGSLYMHASPLAFTNFFLLHKANNSYYNNVLSYLPKKVRQIEWDEYFRYGRRFSSLQVIMEQPGLRAAFWIVLLIFGLIFLFDSKRKQRIIPVIAPLKNASLDFVKTVGRLYYNYRDNKNLGLKMTAHLMDHIRSRYNIPTSTLDERFILTLASKSGYDNEALKKMIYMAKWMQDSPRIVETELMEFHKLTEDFYKHS
ncbi:MAG TPA: DUF4350 domain-containing protein [Chitinophagaceae bacterium]|nr:DUF4350 domain-containing protein [Chitinophagaceae bacterium]